MWRGPVLLLLSLTYSLGEEDCTHGICFKEKQKIKVKNAVQESSDLPHTQKCEVEVKTKDLIAACLPGVDDNFVANSFHGCGNLKKICKHAKRGWLMTTEDKKTVANTDLLLANLKGLAGGEEAVNECLKIEEEYEYYYYDYEYYDEYDYLEEADGALERVRRSPKNGNDNDKPKKGKGGKGKPKGNDEKPKKRSGKKGGKKGGNKSGKNPKRSGKKGGKKGGKNGPKKEGGFKRTGKAKGKGKSKGKGKGKGKGKENGKEKPTKEPETDRKYIKGKGKGNDAAKKENDDKINNQLAKLGLESLPSPGTLEKLDCIYKKVSKLLVQCGKRKLEKP